MTRETVSFRGVSKRYGDLKVLDKVDLEFRAGRISVLLGPNGAGKTTLLRIAAGLQRADAGRVEAEGVAYYGGFDTIPAKGRVRNLFSALGVRPSAPVPDASRLSRLSRGELQLVGLAAFLELRRPCVLLDEPWTALSPTAREDLSIALRERAAGGAVVVCSTHDLDEALRVADEIIFLQRGRGVVQKPPDVGRAALMEAYRSCSA